MTAGDPGLIARNYSATAIETKLLNSISSASQGDTTTGVIVNSISGFPGAVPYTLILDPDTNKEEIVTVTATNGSTTLTVTRGVDNTQAVAHAAGVSVRHGVSAREFRELQAHQASRGYDIDSAILGAANQTHVHGILTTEGVVVGTLKTQALTNKDLSSATNTLPTSAVTLTGSQTLTNKTLTSPTINGGTVASAAVTGLSSPSAGGDAANKTYVDSILGSATAASASAAAALVSEDAAAASEAAALASEEAAALSETSAGTDAGTATTQVGIATTQAGDASTSAGTATTQAGIATTQAGIATTQAGIATTQASNASTSASAAATSASAAAGSATSASDSLATVVDQVGSGLARDMGSITTADTTTGDWVDLTDVSNAAAASASTATTQAGIATTQAGNAATSATASANSATASAGSATDAAATYDSFDDRYLGAKSSAPTLDNDGNALLTGALYFNSVTPGMYVWTGSVWTVMATSGDIESVTAGTGLTGGGTAGAVTVNLDTSSVYVIPNQATNSGKYLTTDGTSASWVSISDWGTL